jgi:hypothetical protein
MSRSLFTNEERDLHIKDHAARIAEMERWRRKQEDIYLRRLSGRDLDDIGPWPSLEDVPDGRDIVGGPVAGLTPVDVPEPDWTQAPDDAQWWSIDADGREYWWTDLRYRRRPAPDPRSMGYYDDDVEADAIRGYTPSRVVRIITDPAELSATVHDAHVDDDDQYDDFNDDPLTW